MPIREDGTSLAELLTPLVPQALTNATATFVDSLKISSTSEKLRRGRRVVVKRRNIYSEQLADLANLYFRMSGILIRFWSKAEDWRRWGGATNLKALGHMAIRRRQMSFTTKRPDERG